MNVCVCVSVNMIFCWNVPRIRRSLHQKLCIKLYCSTFHLLCEFWLFQRTNLSEFYCRLFLDVFLVFTFFFVQATLSCILCNLWCFGNEYCIFIVLRIFSICSFIFFSFLFLYLLEDKTKNKNNNNNVF